jgi:hypothetical protein
VGWIHAAGKTRRPLFKLPVLHCSVLLFIL